MTLLSTVLGAQLQAVMAGALPVSSAACVAGSLLPKGVGVAVTTAKLAFEEQGRVPLGRVLGQSAVPCRSAIVRRVLVASGRYVGQVHSVVRVAV